MTGGLSRGPTTSREQHSLALVGLATALLGSQLFAAVPTLLAVTSVTLVQTVHTSQWDPGSPDPSGLEYLPDQNALVVVDGEVEEDTGAGWHNVNVWFADLAAPQANPTRTMDTTPAAPTNREPVGVAYDETAKELYISKDGASSRIWVYRSGGDGIFGTPDDVQVRFFTISDRGVSDGEGLAFGDGRLWVADGLSKEVWWFGPGLDGVIGTGDDTHGSWDTAVLGQPDPEGMDFDPISGHLWIISNDSKSGLLEVQTDGTAVRSVPLAFLNPTHPGGLAVAPSSNGSGEMSIWIAERGTDNGVNPSENDGRLYELSIAEVSPPPPGTNLLLNGEYEFADANGQPTDWTRDARFTRSSDEVHVGSFAGRHQTFDDSGYKITQDVPVTVGRSYAISGFVNVPPTSDAFELIMKVQWRAAGTLSTVTAVKFTQPTPNWVSWSKELAAPAGATTARFMMVVSSLNATIYVDSFEFTAAGN
jgi:hypothetical protein